MCFIDSSITKFHAVVCLIYLSVDQSVMAVARDEDTAKYVYTCSHGIPVEQQQ